MTNILVSLRDVTLALSMGILIPITVNYGFELFYPYKYSTEQEDNSAYQDKRARVIFYSSAAIAAALVLLSLIIPYQLFSAAFNISAVILILHRLSTGCCNQISSKEMFVVMILILAFVLGVSYRFARTR